MKAAGHQTGTQHILWDQRICQFVDRRHSTEVIYSSSHRDYDFLDERRRQMETGEAWPDQRWFRKDQSKLFWWAWSIFSLSLSDSSVTTSEQVCISSAKDRNFHSDGEWLICLERRTGVKMLPSRHFVRLFCWLIGPSSKRSTFTSPTWNVLNILIYDSNLELIWNHRSESDWDRWFKKQSTGESTSFSSPSGGQSDGNVKLWQYSKHSVLNWCWFSLGG